MNPFIDSDCIALFDELPGWQMVLRPEYTILSASKACLQAHHKTKDEVLGQFILTAFSNEGNKVAMMRLLSCLTQATNSKQLQQIHLNDYWIRNADNSYRKLFVKISCIPVMTVPNTISYMIVHIEDLTTVKDNEERFRSFFDAIVDATIMVNDDGRIVQANKAAETLLQYKSVELEGSPFNTILPDESNDLELNGSLRSSPLLISNKEKLVYAIRKDGTRIPADISFSPIYSENDVLISIRIIDKTEALKAEKQLEILTRQINESNDAIYTIDPEINITSWNRGAEKLFGFTKEEVIGRNSLEVFQMEVSDVDLKSVMSQMAVDGHWQGNIKRKTKSGNAIYLHTSLTVIRDHVGEITGYISVSYDISEERKLRKQVNHLANIVEQSSEVIISRDMNRKILSWNKGAEEMFGFTKEEAIGSTSMQLGVIQLSEKEIKEMDDQLAAHGIWKATKVHYHKNGSSFVGEVTANAVKGSNGMMSSVVIIIKDVSLRKKLEQQLIKNNLLLEDTVLARTAEISKQERRFRALIENSNDIITLLDSSFKLIYRSPSSARITGWADEESIGSSGLRNVHPEDIDRALDLVHEIQDNPGVPFYCKFRNQHKNGNYLWMEGMVVNLLNDPNVNAIVFNFRDATEKILAEEKLIANEHNFRKTLDNMLEGVQIIGFDWRYIYVNDALTKHSRHSREELVGYTVQERHKGIEHTSIYKVYEKCFKERVSIHLTEKFDYPDGSYAWFELSFLPVPEGIAVLSVDITDKKKAESELKESLEEKAMLFERLSVILNNLPANIALLDNQGYIIDVNESWNRFSNHNCFTGNNYRIHSNYIDACLEINTANSEDGQNVANGIQSVLSEELASFMYEYSCASPNQEKWFRMVVTPLRGKDHSGAVVMHIDISELRRLEKERMESRMNEQKRITEAMLSGQEKERNAIGMELHDNVNQVLVATNLYLSVVMNCPEKMNELLPTCMANINDVIKENRKIAHELVTPDHAAETLVQQIQRLTHSMLDAAAVETIISNDAFNEKLLSDPQKLAIYRVVQEQCSNIVKYSKASKVNIHLVTDEEAFNLKISDNGQGMPPGKLSTGIGLRNISSRLDVFNGNLSIETAPHKGFSLCVQMPLRSKVGA